MKESGPGKVYDLASMRPQAERHVAEQKGHEREALETATRYATKIKSRGYEAPTAYDKAVFEQDRKKMAGLSPKQLATMLNEEIAKPETYTEMQRFAIAEALLSKVPNEQY